MKDFITFLSEEEDREAKHVVLVYGRLNPPSLGHAEVISKAKSIAEQYDADNLLILSHTHDKNKNPLTNTQKLKHVERFFPESIIYFSDKDNPGIIQQVRKLSEVYTHLHIVAGEDRLPEYQELLDSYNSKEYNFKQIFYHSSGARDNLASDVSGVSGTKLRTEAKTGNYHSFIKSLPDHLPESYKKELFFDVRKGLGIHTEAIFVIGPPSCGKDVFISQITKNYGLSEMDIDQIGKKIINENQILISGIATEYDKISNAYTKLEEMGYDSMIFYVHVSDEESKVRHAQNPRKYMNETIRYTKWLTSYENINKFRDLAKDNFLFLENSGNIQETIDQLKNIYPTINAFLIDDVNAQFQKFLTVEGYDGVVSPAYGSSLASTSEPMNTLGDDALDKPVPPKKKLKDLRTKNASR